jgi:hypothetical protein
MSEVKRPGGCAVVALGGGVLALAFAGMAMIGVAADWSRSYTIRSQWPLVRAVIRECRVEQRKRRRSDRYVYYAVCSIGFKADGKDVSGGFESLAAYYEHRPASWANPGIDELRAWVAQHPGGSQVNVRYDPSWPPSTELDPSPPIFDWHSPRLFLRVAGIAAMVGVALIGFALVLRR